MFIKLLGKHEVFIELQQVHTGRLFERVKLFDGWEYILFSYIRITHSKGA